jgi:gentisate 1,2-dioxygenase
MTMTLDEARASWKKANLAPLWESATAHKPPPKPNAPLHWSWSEIRPLLDDAIRLVSPDLVERRVLQLRDPHAQTPEHEATVGNLTGALQVLMPKETARPHRHSMNALRLVLEGSGAVTTVNGKRCEMQFGDLILTPAWCWHEHEHRGEGPMIWLDALDVPLHLYLGTVEFQPGPVNDLPDTLPDAAFEAASIAPDVVFHQPYSPLFRYPYARALQALEAAPKGHDGLRVVRYQNPLTGGGPMSLMDGRLAAIDDEKFNLPYRSNSSALCAVIEGDGETRVGDSTVRWSARDIFTLPKNNPIQHRTGTQPAKLFITSDREILQRLGVLKEQIG